MSGNHPRPGRPRRREPRLVPFLATGVILGFFAGGLVANLGAPAARYSSMSQIGYLGLFGAFIGAILAAIAYVVLDRRSQ